MNVKEKAISDNRNHTRKKRHKFGWVFIKFIMLILFTTTIVGTFVGSAWVYSIVKNMPTLDLEKIAEVEAVSNLYDSNGELMDTIISQVKSKPVTIDEVPDTLKWAFVSIEDERFYNHNGVDVKGILGAAFSTVMSKVTGKGITRGGSTLTQQVIKNKIIGLENAGRGLDNIDRKIKEAYLAMELEEKMSKDEILLTYLNFAPMGGTIVGVKAGANTYFNKELKDLNIVQCAFLAGLPQDPARYGPYTETGSEHPELYETRTLTVLRAMFDNGKISEDDFNASVEDIKTNGIHIAPLENLNVATYKYGWFSLPVINQVKKELKRQQHLTDAQIDKVVYQSGIQVYTTMDRHLQDAAQDIINDDSFYGIMDRWEKLDEASDIKTIQPQAAAVIYDYRTGQVRCIIGGRFNEDGSVYYLGYNRAIENGVGDTYIYPIGSTMKPIADYAPAINERSITAAEVIEDAKFPPELQEKYASTEGPYDPRNYSRDQFYGFINIRKALKVSSNIVALKVCDRIGVSKSYEYVKSFGLTLGSQDEGAENLASLGLGQYRANVMEVAKAYGVFGNNGVRTDEILFTKVLDKDGNVILENTPKTVNVLSPQTAYIMYDLLKEPVETGGTAAGLSIGNVTVRGKTGTSSNNENFTFAGLTPYYSGAVWMGNDGDARTYDEHSYKAAVIWAEIMRVAHEGKPNADIQRPDGIFMANICSDSGLLAKPGICNVARKSYQEMFLEGTIPTRECDRHILITVNRLNGLIATTSTPTYLRETRIYVAGDPAIPTRYDQSTLIRNITIPKTNTTNKENEPKVESNPSQESNQLEEINPSNDSPTSTFDILDIPNTNENTNSNND